MRSGLNGNSPTREKKSHVSCSGDIANSSIIGTGALAAEKKLQLRNGCLDLVCPKKSKYLVGAPDQADPVSKPPTHFRARRNARCLSPGGLFRNSLSLRLGRRNIGPVENPPTAGGAVLDQPQLACTPYTRFS